MIYPLKIVMFQFANGQQIPGTPRSSGADLSRPRTSPIRVPGAVGDVFFDAWYTLW